MNKSGFYLTFVGFVPVIAALATSGCATKAYVKAQIATVDSKVAALGVKTNEEAEKEGTDVSRVEEKLGSTDAKVAEVASAAEEAHASANRANQLAEKDKTAIAATDSAVAGNTAPIATLDKAMNYSLVASGNVTFGFNKSNLGRTDEAALDALVQQVQSTPRVEFELLGFTDPVGTPEYNLGAVTPGAQGPGGSVDFIDNRDIRVAQFVASRFFGGIGRFEETLLNPTLAKQRRIAWFKAEQRGDLPGGNLS
jgi:outer membrane protein OmpA-like peptidoglycan-associated protein